MGFRITGVLAIIIVEQSKGSSITYGSLDFFIGSEACSFFLKFEI